MCLLKSYMVIISECRELRAIKPIIINIKFKIDKVKLSQVKIRRKKQFLIISLSMEENIFIKKLLNALILHTKVHI